VGDLRVRDADTGAGNISLRSGVSTSWKQYAAEGFTNHDHISGLGMAKSKGRAAIPGRETNTCDRVRKYLAAEVQTYVLENPLLYS